MNMGTIRRIASVASLAAFLALGTVAGAHLAYAASDAAPDGAAEVHHGHHGRGDLVRGALRLESLTADQRQQIETLLQSERTAHAGVEAARGQLLQALASRVAAGSVDDVALAPNVQALESAIQAGEPGERASLEKLHAILTPAQRVELASKAEEHEARAWSRMKEEREASKDAGHERGHEMWSRMLNLSDAQREQIKTNLRSIGPAPDKTVWKEARETRQRVLEAFKGDRFVMNEIAAPRDPRVVDERVESMVRLAKASAPVLTAEQRAMASAKLQQMAAHMTAKK
jgi:Spy/CpxP family protein refolding chaperone